MSRVTLVTGGARSGKSTYAVQAAYQYSTRAFVATAEASDDEMRDRIEKHKDERGDAFVTVEEPCDLAGAVGGLRGKVDVAVIDCLTVWLGNLMHRDGHKWPLPDVSAFIEMLKDPPCDLVIVTNEVGSGIVPADALSRHYRDMAGSINQQVARIADEVILLVSGIPMIIKEAGKSHGIS